MTRLLQRISWTYLIPVALLLGLAPFRPEPHLLEKLRMLVNGQLTSSIDVFDLIMHGGPLLLILGKLLTGKADPTGKQRG